jgi:hypothetical protein
MDRGREGGGMERYTAIRCPLGSLDTTIYKMNQSVITSTFQNSNISVKKTHLLPDSNP